MKLFHKLSTYLLTHQPLLWHTRIIPLMFTVLLANLIFFMLGYSSVNLYNLAHNYSLENWFFREYYVLYWVILGLVVLIIWGASFYRYNAAKNFYPISKWYFHKMALLIFVPVILYLFIPFTFYSGQALQARNLMNMKEVAIVDSVQVYSAPFLVENTADYEFNRRSYPEMYKNLNYFEHDNTEYDSWTHYKGVEYNIKDLLNEKTAESLLENRNVYAYRSKDVKKFNLIRGDSCEYYETEFLHPVSKDSLPEFHEFHVKNYSIENLFGYDYSYRSRIMNAENLDEFSQKFNKTIHQWIDQSHAKILTTLEELNKLCDQYGIENNLDAKGNLQYLEENEFKVSRTLTFPLEGEEGYMDENGQWVYLNDANNPMFHQAYNFNALNDLLINVSFAHEHMYFHSTEMLLILGYFALGTTMLLLYFQWGSVLSFVISIPVAGVLTILGTLIVLLLKNPWSGDYYSPIFSLEVSVYLVMALSVLGVYYFGKQLGWNTYMVNIAFGLSYFAVPLWIVMFTLLIHQLLTTSTTVPCYEYPEWQEPFSLTDGWGYYVLLYSPYFMFLLSLFTLKGFIAKKEG